MLAWTLRAWTLPQSQTQLQPVWHLFLPAFHAARPWRAGGARGRLLNLVVITGTKFIIPQLYTTAVVILIVLFIVIIIVYYLAI